MMLLIIGLLIFLGIHLVPTQTELRAGLVERFGAGSFKIAFSVISLIGLILIVAGWSKLALHPGKNPILWDPPTWTRHIALALMLPAFILLAAAYIPSNIRSVARHPMLVAIKLWALAHLLANGDLASLVLFGSFLAYAVFDRISVKKREALGPLGRATGGVGGDVAAIGIGAAAYFIFLFWGHELLIGVSPLA